MSAEYLPVLANVESHKKFMETYPKFCDALAGIVELTNRVTVEAKTEDADQDRQLANVLMYELSVLTFEDFDEIVLLCADGHPRGGLKILRGMFERSVTLFEIDEHPEQGKLFYEYTHIDRYKLATQMQQEYPGKFFTKEKLAELRAKRDEVKANYLRACKNCGHETVGTSWMEYGIVELARQRGFKGSLLLHAYYDALNETHPKMEAIFRRQLERNAPWKADTGRATIHVAHILVPGNVRAMKERFKMKDLEQLYQRCDQEYKEAWPSEQKAE
ncbi:MAG: DUF5677 domain-containing protein [Acidobacteriota bacterium]